LKAGADHRPDADADPRRDADADLRRDADADLRPAVNVAVGVLLAADGSFLLASRPPGKVYAGHWEFPGGKLEPGESVEAALTRELHEELGIQVTHSQRWRVDVMSYEHAKVRLFFCKVTGWEGEPRPREGQRLAWQNLPVTVLPLLRGTIPVLSWLAQERQAVNSNA
jgi:8-oxo-dGTP diphosphatase